MNIPHFANPWAFALLAALAALIAMREWRTKLRRAALPFPDLSIAAALPKGWRVRLRNIPDYLMYAGFALAVAALARPQNILKGEEARARGIDIMLCLDTSGSMRALDFDPLDRMGAAKKAMRNFIMHRQYDRMGLVVFAGVSLLQCPLTLDYAALLEFLEQVEVGMTTTENTAIGTAIATATNHLKKSSAKSRVIILATDGRNNSGEIDPVTAAKAANAIGIRVYTIGVGIRGQSVIPVQHPVYGRQLVPIQEDLDEPVLMEIARVAGGRYYRATSAKELQDIYAQIDRMEKTEVKGVPPSSYEDLYRKWLLAATAFIAAAVLLQITVFRGFP